MSIISNGLIAHFDPDNTTSYSGVGNTLASLVGSVAGTLGGSYSKTTGGISVNGYLQLPQLSNITTISIWFKRANNISSDALSYLLDGREGGNGTYIYGYGTGPGWNTTGGKYYLNGESPQDIPYDFMPLFGGTIWQNITITTPTPFNDNLTLFARFTQNESLNATFGPIMIYNRAITQAENTANFDVICSRYGLTPINVSAPAPAPAPATAPGAPTTVSATAGNGQATVSWTAPASNGGAAITSYTVTSSPGGFTATTANGDTTTATVVGLTNGTAYTFTVKATNSAGNSSASAASSAITPAITGVAISPVNMGLLSYASLFIANDGKLYKSGSLYYGSYPGVAEVTVPGNKAVKQAVTGNTNAAYLTVDGLCYHVSLGLSDSDFVKVTIPGTDTNVKITSIALVGTTDPGSIIMVLENGSVYGFGNNTYGQLGNGATTNVSRSSPVKMALPVGVSAVAAIGGANWTYIIDSNGNLYVCGRVNAADGYPTNTTAGNITAPISCMKDSLLGKKVVGVTGLGLVHCSDNTLHTIGLADRNGHGSALTAHTQLTLSALTGKTIKIMDASYYHNAVLCTDGTVIVFGKSTSVTDLTSTMIQGEATGVLISNISIMWNFNNNTQGDYDLFAILSNGKVFSYGGNFNNEIGTGPSQSIARRQYPRTDILHSVYNIPLASLAAPATPTAPATASAAIAVGTTGSSGALQTYISASTATPKALALEVRAAIKNISDATAKAAAKADYIAAIRAKEPTLKVAVPQTDFSTYIATLSNVPTAVQSAPRPVEIFIPTASNIVDIGTATVDETKYTQIEMPINTVITVQDNGTTVGTLTYNGSIYTDGNGNTYDVGNSIIFGTKKVTILGKGSALVEITNTYTPIEVNLNVEINANGNLNILGYQPTTPTNLVIASTLLPVDALYDEAAGIGLIEFWEPDDINDIIAQLASTQTLDGVEGYRITAKKLVLSLQNCLIGELDAKSAEPFNAAPKYGTAGVQNGNRVMIGFGRLALMAYAHYIMGHVQATAAITNDKDFIRGMLSLNSDTLSDYKYANIGNYDAAAEPWTGVETPSDANLAARLVMALIDNNPSTSLASTNTATSVANIVKQVIGQDASRATDEDNSKYLPENHGLLRFYPNDVIYVSINLLTPDVTVGAGQQVTDTTMEGLYANAEGNKKYTIKLTLGPAA
jgi:hypothetical protein